MMMKRWYMFSFGFCLVFLTTILLTRIYAQEPIGSAFTYQGRLLNASGTPVNGQCDMSFLLYDADTDGSQIGATVTITGITMTDGYFTAAPDFGSSAFDGEERWLELVAICPPGGSPITMTRQAINAVPYAIYALNSGGVITLTEHTHEWNDITDPPSSYTPTMHTQDWSTITGQLETYTPTAHMQDWSTITGQPESYTPTAHTQDWSTITGQPETYTPTAHTQNWGTIIGQPASYTPTAHTQDRSSISGTVNQVGYFAGSPAMLFGNANLTYDGNTLDVGGTLIYNSRKIKSAGSVPTDGNWHTIWGPVNGHVILEILADYATSGYHSLGYWIAANTYNSTFIDGQATLYSGIPIQLQWTGNMYEMYLQIRSYSAVPGSPDLIYRVAPLIIW